MSVETVRYRNDVFVTDTETGEVFYMKIENKKKIPEMEKYVGIDTKYPYECTTKENLNLSLSQLDAYLNEKPKVNYQFLLDSVVEHSMGKAEASVLKAISEDISGWNIFIGTTKEVAEKSKIDPSNVARTLKASKHIRILSAGKPPKGLWVLEINPVLVWKGDVEFREDRLVSWYLKPNGGGCDVIGALKG